MKAKVAVGTVCRTRDGRKATIICNNAGEGPEDLDSDLPLLALVESEDEIKSYTANGKYDIDDTEQDLDLMLQYHRVHCIMYADGTVVGNVSAAALKQFPSENRIGGFDIECWTPIRQDAEDCLEDANMANAQ